MMSPRSKTSAQGLVEFALILPVFLLVLFVILDLGRMAFYYSAVHNAAREGARYGSIYNNTSPPGSITAAAESLTSGMDITVTTSYPDTETIQVTVTYVFTPATPFLNLLIGSDTFTLSSTATMNGEW